MIMIMLMIMMTMAIIMVMILDEDLSMDNFVRALRVGTKNIDTKIALTAFMSFLVKNPL